jgi:hypothetical protein
LSVCSILIDFEEVKLKVIKNPGMVMHTVLPALAR